jgi:hypothetical protein
VVVGNDGADAGGWASGEDELLVGRECLRGRFLVSTRDGLLVLLLLDGGGSLVGSDAVSVAVDAVDLVLSTRFRLSDRLGVVGAVASRGDGPGGGGAWRAGTKGSW